MKIIDLKNKIKQEIIIQKDLKAQRKENYKGKRSFSNGIYTAQQEASFASIQKRKFLRLHHIAYCLLRGKQYEQIENKVHDRNKLMVSDWDMINKIKEQYNEQYILRNCA